MEPLWFKSDFLGNSYASKGLNIVDSVELQSFILVHPYTIITPFYIYTADVNTTPYQIVSFSSASFDPCNLP